MPAPDCFITTMAENFCSSRTYYGDINISLDLFTGYVWNIACKHLGTSSDESVIIEFTKKLYLRDLYLACGCVHKSEIAWKTFDVRYRKLITDLVRFCYRYGTDSEEIADLILVSLYFQDRSGRQRIASYDGRSSLATWLRVIVINRAINEKHERRLAYEESVVDVPDVRALANFEEALRAERYSKILRDSLAHALRQLTAAERLMLLCRYEENMALGDMADLLGIHQSNVTRRLLRVQARLRESMIQTLASQHGLSAAAIQECLAEALDNPLISVSVVSLIKEAPISITAAQERRPPGPRNDELPRAANDR